MTGHGFGRLSSATGDPSDDGTVRVLYVDSNPEADETARNLEQERPGLSVTTADSATDALARLDDQSFDCVVAEYALPEGTGLELLVDLRETDPDLPFIIYTGEGSEGVASESISAGVTDYLQKLPHPDHHAVLTNRIGNAVEQHRAAQRAEHHRQRMQAQAAAMQASIDGMAILDDEGTYKFVNQAHVDVYGYDDADEFLGESWEMCYGPDELERLYEEVMPEITASAGWRGEATGRRADGSEFPQELSVSQTEEGRIVCVVRDITERKERERRIEEQTRQLRAILDTTSAAIFLKDADGRYLLMNDECADLLGVDDVDEAIGLTDHDLFPESAAEKFMEDDRRVLEDGVTLEVEEEVPTDDGSRSYLSLKNPVYGEDGNPYAVCGVATDITGLKERERELERERNRLEEFADIVSHDLRNPLNVASGALSLVVEDSDSRHLATVERAHDRMEVLIEDLLTLAREGETVEEPEPVSLATVAEDAWTHVESGTVTLEVVDDATVLADRNRFQQFLENLARNALEHGRPADADGFTVTVGHNDGTPGERGFYVADDGVGIPPDRREDVFDAGHTSHPDGTGFGLAIVEQIAEAHGWRVGVTESEDDGARFEVTGVEFAE
jgi:PAS domain S-box-containing protein